MRELNVIVNDNTLSVKQKEERIEYLNNRLKSEKWAYCVWPYVLFWPEIFWSVISSQYFWLGDHSDGLVNELKNIQILVKHSITGGGNS